MGRRYWSVPAKAITRTIGVTHTGRYPWEWTASSMDTSKMMIGASTPPMTRSMTCSVSMLMAASFRRFAY
jgi:hypothetical protein